MEQEPPRFKKARSSGGQSNCIEVAHTLWQLRDSKAACGPVLEVNVRALVVAVRDDVFER